MRWGCALVGSLVALGCGAVALADSVVLDDHATFRWTPSVGPYDGYEVYALWNGAKPIWIGVTATPEWTVSSDANAVAQIAVRAYSQPGSSGTRMRGELSEPSDPVRLLGPSASLLGVGALESRSEERVELRALSGSVGSGALASLALPGTNWRLLHFGGLTGSHRAEALLRDTSTGALRLGELSSGSMRLRALLFGVGLLATRPLLGDFDADGLPELALHYPETDQLVIWKIQSDRFTVIATLPAPSSATLVSTKDFDGDGRGDLWFTSNDGQLTVYPIPQLRIDQAVPLRFPLRDYAVADVADYDGDGRPDTLWRDAAGSLVISQLRGSASAPGSVLLALTPLADSAAKIVSCSADLDGVAGAEILVQQPRTGAVDALYPRDATPGRSRRVLEPGLGWRLVQGALP